jgi:uncharacterized protein YegL
MSSEKRKRPGGEMATRPLHFIFLCDVSGSMSVNGKIQALNTAIREAIPHMKKVADENPNAHVLVRVIKFSDGAQWHILNETPVENFKWHDLGTSGLTDMGKAFSMVADQLKIPPMTDRALPPVLALLSDGYPTDDWKGGLKKLMDLPWGKKAVRVAIAIGREADMNVLQEFIGNPEIKPLLANNADQLVRYIKWVSTAVLKSASAPASQAGSPSGGNVPVPPPPDDSDEPSSAGDVW